MLEPIWKTFQDGDYDQSLCTSLEALVTSGGVDLLHIAGLSLMNLQRHDEGLMLLKAAVTMRPDQPHIHINAAYIAEQCGLRDAVTYFTEIGLADYPDNIDLLLLKANNYVSQLQFDEAERIYRELLVREPNHIQSIINLGNICRARNDFLAASRYFDDAENLEPNYRDLIFARATMYTQQGQSEKAVKLLEPIAYDVDAQFLLGLLYLSHGDYDRGLRLFRSRANSIWYKSGNFVYPLSPFDHWTEAEGKHIAIVNEGGQGDVIQNMRYLPMLAEVAKSITLFVPPSLIRLMHTLPSNVSVKSTTDRVVKAYDFITTEVELPYHFRTTIDTIPNPIPYVSVSAEAIKQLELPPTLFKRVGICWAGGPRDNLNQRSYDERRSMDLSLLAPLQDIAGIEFVSLQYGPRGDDAGMALTRVIDSSFDYYDTATIIAQLDLVISVDTSVAHLAAAMGKKTWMLSRYDACWRWCGNRPDAPWYPGVMRVFGQKAYADWTAPLNELQAALKEWVAHA